MSLTITPGLWILPAFVAVVCFAWVCWPRPDEWESHGDYSWPSGLLILPARIGAATVAVLVAVIMWRW